MARHAKRSHTHLKDSVVYVRVPWIMETADCQSLHDVEQHTKTEHPVAIGFSDDSHIASRRVFGTHTRIFKRPKALMKINSGIKDLD